MTEHASHSTSVSADSSASTESTTESTTDATQAVSTVKVAPAKEPIKATTNTKAKPDRIAKSQTKNDEENRVNNRRRSFKGLSLEQRQNERREKLIEAGLQIYGTQGFFSVTVRDICNEAKLTERYFYESFKRSEELFKTIYLRLIEQLQQDILAAVMQSKVTPRLMINSGLNALLKALQDDPRMARILFIDAILVHELQGNTIYEAVARFDRMIQAFMMLMFPKKHTQAANLSLVSTGLNGYVTHIAMRWVIGGFKEPRDQILVACEIAYLSILQWMETQPEQ